MFKIINFIWDPLYKDRDFLHQKYIVEGLSIAKISELISSSNSTVHKYLKHFDIPLRPFDAKNKNRLKFGEAWRKNQLAEHKREKTVLKKIASLRKDGFSYWKIADILNSINTPTKTRRGKWHARSVKKVLDDNLSLSNSSSGRET